MKNNYLMFIFMLFKFLTANYIVVPDDYVSIQEAVNNSQIGDTILIKEGEYSESISINHAMNLIGANSDNVIIKGAYDAPAITISSDETRLQNLYIISHTAFGNPTGTGFSGQTVIKITSSNNVVLNNLIIESGDGGMGNFSGGSGGTAIEIIDSDSSKISNTIISTGDAASGYSGSGGGQGGTGILVNNSNFGSFTNLNIIAGHGILNFGGGKGLYIVNSEQVYIDSTRSVGGYLAGSGLYVYSSLNINITNSSILGGASSMEGGFGARALNNSHISITNSELIGGDGVPDGQPFFKDSSSTIDTSNVSISSIDKEKSFLSSSIFLYQNYPNPFNSETIISFSLLYHQSIRIELYNSLGEKVKTILNEHMNAGDHNIIFNAELLPSGVYFYKLTTRQFSNVKKMLLIK